MSLDWFPFRLILEWYYYVGFKLHLFKLVSRKIISLLTLKNANAKLCNFILFLEKWISCSNAQHFSQNVWRHTLLNLNRNCSPSPWTRRPATVCKSVSNCYSKKKRTNTTSSNEQPEGAAAVAAAVVDQEWARWHEKNWIDTAIAVYRQTGDFLLFKIGSHLLSHKRFP